MRLYIRSYVHVLAVQEKSIMCVELASRRVGEQSNLKIFIKHSVFQLPIARAIELATHS